MSETAFAEGITADDLRTFLALWPIFSGAGSGALRQDAQGTDPANPLFESQRGAKAAGRVAGASGRHGGVFTYHRITAG